METALEKTLVRSRYDISNGWTFFKGKGTRQWLEGFQGPADDCVDLPHCWNTRDTHPESKAYYRGYGSYRRSIQVPVVSQDYSSKVLWRIESEGFYGVGELWIDGEKVTTFDGQYLGFRADVTSRLTGGGEHRVGIRLTNRCSRNVLPGIDMPDFILHGGLAGRIFLRSVPRQHLDETQLLVQGRIAGEKNGVLDVQALAVNAGPEEKTFRVEWIVKDSDGRMLVQISSSETTCAPFADCRFDSKGVVLDNITHWSLESPTLYRLEAVLYDGGVVVDHISCRFGIRTAEFRPDQGFFLNGKPVKLRGCNRHEYWPGYGNALPLAFHRDDARVLKDMGMNFVRLSHYPQHPSFLDACDEEGLMVYAEIATWKSVRSSKPWISSAVRQMAGMIVRDRNHPSIILWGMGNESRSRRAYLRLREVARILDPTRPVIYAENHWHRARRQKTLDISDVWGANYELDQLENGRKACSLRSVVVSECANYPHARRGDRVAEARQIEIMERDWEAIGNRSYVAGFALWCMTDYPTLRKKRYIRYSGLLDGSRIAKMSVNWYKNRFIETPHVALHGDWSETAFDSAKRTLHVFTNCEETHLVCQGRDIEIYKGPQVLHSTITYCPERLFLRGFKGGQPVETFLDPHGPAHTIRLSLEIDDSAIQHQVPILLHIEICDDKGRRVANWNGRIDLGLEGPFTLDSTYRSDSVDIANGYAKIWIHGHGYSGKIFVTAWGEGLAPGKADGEVTGNGPLIETSQELWAPLSGHNRRRPWMHCHAAHVLLQDLPVTRSFGWACQRTHQGSVYVINREHVAGAPLSKVIPTASNIEEIACILAKAHCRNIITGAVSPGHWVLVNDRIMLENLRSSVVVSHFNPATVFLLRKEIRGIRDGWLCKTKDDRDRFNAIYSKTSHLSIWVRMFLGIAS